MDNQVHNQIVSFIWGIADDCLRDVYVRGKYRDVILPMTVIRRLDAMLEETKRLGRRGPSRLGDGLLTGAVFAELPKAAPEVRQLAVFQAPDASGEFLYEIPVVRDEEQGLRVALQRILHPLAGGKVEMVRRFVQDEQVQVPAHEHTQPQPRR